MRTSSFNNSIQPVLVMVTKQTCIGGNSHLIACRFNSGIHHVTAFINSNVNRIGHDVNVLGLIAVPE